MRPVAVPATASVQRIASAAHHYNCSTNLESWSCGVIGVGSVAPGAVAVPSGFAVGGCGAPAAISSALGDGIGPRGLGAGCWGPRGLGAARGDGFGCGLRIGGGERTFSCCGGPMTPCGDGTGGGVGFSPYVACESPYGDA